MSKATRTEIVVLLTPTREGNACEHIRQFHDGTQVSVRMDDGELLELLRGHSGTMSGMCYVASAVQYFLRCGARDSSHATQRGRYHPRGHRTARRGDREGGVNTPGTPTESGVGMLYADDAAVVSRSPDGLVRMLNAIVRVY